MRLLAGLAPADDAATPQPAIAQRLGQWLDWTDAIPLSAVLGGGTAAAAAPTPAAPSAKSAKSAGATGAASATRAARAALARVRADLTRAISADAVFAPARPGAGVGAMAGAMSGAVAGAVAADTGGAADGDDFAPYRRACQTLQRAMAGRIAPLRQQVRAALGQASPALARLAALDAVMDEWLAARERSLLAGVATLLERRCEQLRQQAPQDWRAGLAAEMQDVLLAELDVRLQPVEGLIEALGQETP